PFELRQSAELSERGVAFTHAYFPNTGFISLVVDVDSYPPLEVGVVGRESMLGSELLLGVVTSPWRSLVQVAGTCWRIDAQGMRQAMADMPTLQALLQRNLMVRVHQHQSLASASAGQRH
ncbi:MAG: Crp/Fnr family transcriptional regulator, partial [Hydrogenophaga sp.]|nr:Crp/Fnr family transcriptional regulator [Hydrogenophaga sp.]